MKTYDSQINRPSSSSLSPLDSASSLLQPQLWSHKSVFIPPDPIWNGIYFWVTRRIAVRTPHNSEHVKNPPKNGMFGRHWSRGGKRHENEPGKTWQNSNCLSVCTKKGDRKRGGEEAEAIYSLKPFTRSNWKLWQPSVRQRGKRPFRRSRWFARWHDKLSSSGLCVQSKLFKSFTQQKEGRR